MPISNSNVNFNVNFQFQSNPNVKIPISIQFQCQFPISNPMSMSTSISNVNVNFQSNFNPISMSIAILQSDVNVYVSIQFQFPISTFNLNFQCQFSIQINVNLLSIYSWANKNGHVYFQIKSMTIYPLIGILLNQTLNWYLVTGQVPGSIRKKNHLYLLVYLCFRTNGKFDRTVCTQFMLCYQSNGKFDLKNSLYPAYALLSVRQQVQSEEQFVPSLCFVIGQTTGSI
jgi:hypothetical protein